MTDADVHPSDTEEPTLEFDHVTVENDHAPDECAIFPRDASEDVLMTAWISAHDDSFVDLESIR
ncbi:DUF7511 domain-containing protein [Natrinema caseinilyticum]|uniref:DUF7511 domain-containing protein n=1 Tax=Natrinema caseinilyticum TaxID=2961570 RepID=UPI0020C24A27|nr:hypothetical protein [Natrinema caseinilyticum]